MSYISINDNLNCLNPNNLGADCPFEDQSALARIGNVALYVLMLAIPLVIYRITVCRRPKPSPVQIGGNLQAVGIGSVQQDKGIVPDSLLRNDSVQRHRDIVQYSSLGSEALIFAREQLQGYRNSRPSIFSQGEFYQGKLQPMNPEINLLEFLYEEITFKNFQNLVKQNETNPWASQKVIEAADECMKIAYAISNLTLDDLEVFTEARSCRGERLTYAKALTDQGAYLYRSFVRCTIAYHLFRGAIAWGRTTNYFGENIEKLTRPKVIPETHAIAFYQKGTIQSSWNELYNEYCARTRVYVDEEALRTADQRYCYWTEKDTGIESFYSVPDSLPT